MTGHQDEPWRDGDAGQLVRPYALTNGRTQPAHHLDLLSMVRTTGQVAAGRLDPVYDATLGLCLSPTSVAEVAARLQQPAIVTKVLLADLIELGAVTTRAPRATAEAPNPETLRALLHGLQQL